MIGAIAQHHVPTVLVGMAAKGVAGHVLGEFLLRFERVADLLLTVVVVVLELHQEVGLHELFAVRIDERGKGLARGAQQPQGDFVAHVARRSALRVVLRHLLGLHLGQDVESP